MTTAEAMAIAVLKGDLLAARALADHLLEDHPAEGRQLPPIHKLPCEVGRLKVVVWLNGERLNQGQISNAVQSIRQWLIDGNILLLPSDVVSRLDLYEIDHPHETR